VAVSLFHTLALCFFLVYQFCKVFLSFLSGVSFYSFSCQCVSNRKVDMNNGTQTYNIDLEDVDPSVVETSWSSDGCALTVVRRYSANDATVTTTVSWPSPPEERFVRIALGPDPRVDKLAADAKGGGHKAKIFKLPLNTSVVVFRDWGPPLWVFPRFVPSLTTRRLTVYAGWRFQCVGVTFNFRPEKTSA